MKINVLATWSLIFGLFVCTAVQAQHATIVTGRNVTQVIYSTVSQPMGRFELAGNNQWIEYSDHNNSRFNFIERARDDWSVYLYDASRDVSIQLDLHRNKVGYAQGNQPKGDIYNIIASNSRQLNQTVYQPTYTAPSMDPNRVRDFVSFELADGAIASFQQYDATHWLEYSPHENVSYQYDLQQRTDSAVYLYEPSRNLYAQIDFNQNIVIFTRASGPDPQYFYALLPPEQAQYDDNQFGRNRNNHHHHRHNNAPQYVPTPSEQPPQITGFNVARVVFGEGNTPLGEFVKSGVRRWTQYTKNSGVTISLEEQRRDQYTVYLFDITQNLPVQLDLRNNKVTYGADFKVQFNKYDILRSEL